MEVKKRENWGSTLGFVLAIAGSAIGLGNVWKFPYITGQNGGGAFVLVYLFCIFLLGMPIMLCEMAIGRKTRQNPYGAFRMLEVRRSRLSKVLGWLLIGMGLVMLCSGKWGFALLTFAASALVLKLGFAAVGLFSLFAAMLILSYYSVIGGWIVEYVYKAFSGQLNVPDVESAEKLFSDFIGNPMQVTRWHLLFLGLAALMIWCGIRNGIERWSKILMPTLFFLLVALLLRGVTLSGASKGVAFFLTPDFSKLTAAGALEALGHAFYTLSLGMAITITYGSYLGRDKNIFTSALWVVLLDTGAALLAGLAIFPAVFAMGFDPSAGPSLIFKVLPATFYNFPGGFGVLTSVSCATWEHLPGVHGVLEYVFGEVESENWFVLLDYVTSNWMLPLSGLFTAIFVGWVWTTRKAGRELRISAGSLVDENLITYLSGFRGEPLYRSSRNHGLTVMTLWGLLVRFVAPVVILALFLQSIGVNLGF